MAHMTPCASDRGWGGDPSRVLQGRALSASILGGGGDRSPDADARDSPSPAPRARRLRSPQRRQRGQRIVVVDDEADLVDILAEALRADGYVAQAFTHPVH